MFLVFCRNLDYLESRNERVFKDVQISILQAMDIVKFRGGWWFKNFRKGSSDPITLILLNIAERCTDVKRFKFPNPKEWIPPVLETLKFNVDGSARGAPGHAGIGGVLRDSCGKVLCVFSEFVGILDSVSSKLMAIARACSLCASRPELNRKKIVVVSECKLAVAWINSNGVGDWSFLQQILEIRGVINNGGQIFVEFNHRETNSFADDLAKKGAGGGDILLNWNMS